jgi:CspA family cold shock protein
VKWFNSEKGFGFVEFTDGSAEAFLHISAVERAGHSALEPGTTLIVRTGQGQKGPHRGSLTGKGLRAARLPCAHFSRFAYLRPLPVPDLRSVCRSG